MTDTQDQESIIELVDRLRKGQGFTLQDLADGCGLYDASHLTRSLRSQLERNRLFARGDESRKEGIPPLVGLRLLRILKPSLADVPKLLDALELRPLFAELGTLFYERGGASIVTAETGITWSKSVQWMIQTRIATEQDALRLLALQGLAPDRQQLLQQNLNEWERAIQTAALGELGTVHADFHINFVTSADWSALKNHKGIEQSLKSYHEVVSAVLWSSDAQQGLVIDALWDIEPADKFALYTWTQEDSRRRLALHAALFEAVAQRRMRIAERLLDLHWGHDTVSPEELAAIQKRYS